MSSRPLAAAAPAAIAFALALVAAPRPAAAAAQAPPICQTKPCIQVGGFNVEHLGTKNQDGAPVRARTPEQLDAVADLLSEELDLEVFVLEEIDTRSDDWARVEARLAGRGYRFHEGTSSERGQFVVLGWDADEVQLADGSAQELQIPGSFTDPLNPTCRTAGLRVPIAGRFTAGQFDFWVVGVHLKSRLRIAGAPLACASWVRQQQAALVVGEVERLMAASGERDFLIVGDFNEEAGHASLAPLSMAGFTSQMSYRMQQSGTCSYLPGCPDLIDHVMLYLPETRELARRSGFVLAPADLAAFEERYSDHVPVWTSFVVDADLD